MGYIRTRTPVIVMDTGLGAYHQMSCTVVFFVFIIFKFLSLDALRKE